MLARHAELGVLERVLEEAADLQRQDPDAWSGSAFVRSDAPRFAATGLQDPEVLTAQGRSHPARRTGLAISYGSNALSGGRPINRRQRTAARPRGFGASQLRTLKSIRSPSALPRTLTFGGTPSLPAQVPV